MRTSEIKRNTSETKINLKINLDGSGVTESDSGLPFLDHMIDQIGKHGLIDIDLKAEGDLHIDCLLYTSPSPRDRTRSRMPSSA